MARRVRVSQGYRLVQLTKDRSAPNGGYLPEHVLIASRAVGFLLPDSVEVHHVNEDRADNRPSNLVICENRAYHALLHARARAKRESGHADWLRCITCKRYDAPETMRLRRRVERKAQQFHAIHINRDECRTQGDPHGRQPRSRNPPT